MRLRQWVAIIFFSIVYIITGHYLAPAMLDLAASFFPHPVKLNVYSMGETIGFHYNLTFLWTFCAVLAAVIHRVNDRLVLKHYFLCLLLVTAGAFTGVCARLLFLRSRYSIIETAGMPEGTTVSIRSLDLHTWGMLGAFLVIGIYLVWGRRKGRKGSR
jgi:hypothetical protein